MAVKIKLKRMGKIRAPYYRIVIADSRTKRDGRAIEEIGKYHPKQEPSLIEVDSERVQYWLSVGAQPTEAVAALLRVTGDWQRFKGLPGGEGTLKVAEPRADKKAVFDKAAKEAMAEPREGSTTTKARGGRSEARPATGRTAKSEAATGEAETPAAGAAESAPAESAPAQSAPAQSAPAQSAPAESAPAESAPAQSAPAESAPAESTEA